MRQPGWWYDPEPRLAARLLAPLGLAYAGATAWRLSRATPDHAGVPVICVGNLDAGGTGKTPVTIALAERLSGRGVPVHVVSRGYGGRLAGPERVLPSHGAADVGDEPLLISAFVPTWVARDRAAGVRAAAAAGARAVILDDGFQNPSVRKDLSIVVVDAARGWGNGRAIPAGPLRESVAAGLARADAVISLGEEVAQDVFRARWGSALRSLPHLRGALRPLPTGMPWAGLRALAFAGIGQPGKFFATLKGLGAEIVATRSFDDHEPLSRPLLQRLEADAARLGAQLVTTEKDAVRLPPSMRARVLTLPVRLHLESWDPLDARLDRLGLGQSQGEPRQP
ncbi:tetraacyldisaccharide 4'-kinase [Rubellimicrobium arenae]|uniref:tetraacyldisaccharide 4'-kinase n=1 Tax=Rubellimicrobium arenae TaxID=2817372 RepID=UPI001B317C51|nr:tetraacyldisaccharide 4'-kinase [Rubellimicrobium arenae]